MNWTWILWTILGLILIVAEVFTSGFVLCGLASVPGGSAGGDSVCGKPWCPVSDLCHGFNWIDRSLADHLSQLLSREQTGDSVKTGVDALLERWVR